MNKVVKKISARRERDKNFSMNTKLKISIGIVFILIAIGAILMVGRYFLSDEEYYAVYLRTGDLYFGKLSKFPMFKLSNIYTIQVTQDQQTPFRIQKFSDIFWGPENYLNINDDEVVWYTKLNSKGQLYQLIKTNPNLIPPQQQQIPQQVQQVPEDTEKETEKNKATTTE